MLRLGRLPPWLVILSLSLTSLLPTSSAAKGLPAVGRWQRLPNAPNLITYPAATSGPDGNIYVLTYKAASGNVLPLQIYDPRTGYWRLSSAEPPFPGDYTTLVTVGRTIYAVGGTDFSEATPLAEYSIAQDTWITDPSAQCGHEGGRGTVGPNGLIYVAGGYSGLGLESCLDIYNPRTRVWDDSYATPIPVMDPGVAAGPDGRIYILGGAGFSTGNKVAVFGATQIFDSRTRTWTTGPAMPTARTALAAVTGADGRIYAIGGTPDPYGMEDVSQLPHPRALRTVEAYSPRAGKWAILSGLNVPRYGLAAVMGSDGYIYAIGGSNSSAMERLKVPTTVAKR
jgi:hypothetical protein